MCKTSGVKGGAGGPRRGDLGECPAGCIAQAAVPSMRRSCWPPGGISSVPAAQDSQGPFPRGFLRSSRSNAVTVLAQLPPGRTSCSFPAACCRPVPSHLWGAGGGRGRRKGRKSVSSPVLVPSLFLPGAHPASWRPCPGKGLSCPRLEAPGPRPEEPRRSLRWRGKPDSPSAVNLCLNPHSPSSFTSTPFHSLLACLCTWPRPTQLSSGFPSPLPPHLRQSRSRYVHGLATCWPCGWDTLPALSESVSPVKSGY